MENKVFYRYRLSLRSPSILFGKLTRTWAQICKRLRSPGIDSASLCSLAGMSNTVVIPAHQTVNRFLGSLKGLQIWAQGSLQSSWLLFLAPSLGGRVGKRQRVVWQQSGECPGVRGVLVCLTKTKRGCPVPYHSHHGWRRPSMSDSLQTADYSRFYKLLASASVSVRIHVALTKIIQMLQRRKNYNGTVI
jgi:hypothetical protein